MIHDIYYEHTLYRNFFVFSMPQAFEVSCLTFKRNIAYHVHLNCLEGFGLVCEAWSLYFIQDNGGMMLLVTVF
jgi:hypothetical protein